MKQRDIPQFLSFAKFGLLQLLAHDYFIFLHLYKNCSKSRVKMF